MSPIPSTPRNCGRCLTDFMALPGEVVCRGCRKPPQHGEAPSSALSLREQQLVVLIAGEALINKEIAYRLHLTEGTVKVYLTRLFRKLGVSGRFDLMTWAYRNVPELRP